MKDQLHNIHLKQLKIVSSHHNINFILLIGPDDAPQDFIFIPTKTDVTFNWRRPAIPNGIITRYRLVAVVNLGANTFTVITQLIDVTSNQNTMSITVGVFSPYQNYTTTVSATTVWLKESQRSII